MDIKWAIDAVCISICFRRQCRSSCHGVSLYIRALSAPLKVRYPDAVTSEKTFRASAREVVCASERLFLMQFMSEGILTL
jgi:hypothetical protein